MLRWLEGFEGTTSVSESHERVYGVTDAKNLVPAVGSTFTSPTELWSCVSNHPQYETPVLVGAVQNSWIMGLAVRSDNLTSLHNTQIPSVSFGNTDGEQIRFEFTNVTLASAKPGGYYFKVRVMRGATELASSNEYFEMWHQDYTRGWFYFEFKTTIHDSTGSFEGRFRRCNKPGLGSGYTALTWDAASTGLDTQNQTSAGADRSTLSWDCGNSAPDIAYDDWYICDSTGAKNNDYLGRIVIEGQKPSTVGGGDGNTTDWSLATATSTEDALAEPLTSVETGKRLTSDATAQVHLAVMLPLDWIKGGTIVGVRQDIHCKMETTGSLDIGHRFRKTTGTPAETDGGTDLNIDSTTVKCGAAVLEDDPNTATAWVYADLDSYQHGVINNG